MASAAGLRPADAVEAVRPAGRVRAALEANAFVVLALGACVGLQAALLRTAIKSDTWLSLLAGRTIVRHGLPHHDTLTAIAAGRTWVDQQWLAQLGLYGLWSLGGWPTVLLTGIALYAGSFSVLAASARRLGASERSAAVLLFACFLTGLPGTALRAQVLAYLLFALVLALVLGDERRPTNRVFLALPLLVLWANLHGSVLLGAALVALRGATVAAGGIRRGGRWLPRAAALVGLPWLCALASPYGLALPGYYRRVLDNRALTHAASEWAPSTLRGQPMFFALLLAAVVLAVLARRRLSPIGLVALGGSAVLGLLAVRNVVWFALAVAAVVPAALDAVWPERPSARRRRVNGALALAAVGFAVALAVIVSSRGRAWFERPFPRAAAAAVASAARAEPGAQVFANERYADWLLFEQPSLTGRVAYDIRWELLRQPELSWILSVRRGNEAGWQRAAHRYGLLVLNSGEDAGAVRLFENQPGTAILYRGRSVVVLRMSR